MAATTDRKRLKNAQAAQLASNEGVMVSTAKAAVADAHRRQYTIQLTDAATAGTAVTETVMARIPVACRLITAYMSAPIAVTANDTTYATVTVAKRTGAGGATTLASQTTKITGGSGNLAAFVPAALTNTATSANLAIAAGDVVTVAVAKASTGVALTAATSTFNVTLVLEEV